MDKKYNRAYNAISAINFLCEIMNDHMENNRRRMTAGAIGFVVLVVVMFSSVYIAKESVHNCHGEDCPICACIQQCEDMLHQLGNGLLGILIINIAFAIFITSGIFPVLNLIYQTPVSRKIRLNN